MGKKNGDKAPDPTILKGQTVRKKDKNANYDFSVQKEPANPFGHGQFANMPEKPMFMGFDREHSYRDGIVNSFTVGLTDLTKIHENESKEY
jgi:hypothetical protein